MKIKSNTKNKKYYENLMLQKSSGMIIGGSFKTGLSGQMI
jgi:hypothetical protein